MMRVDDVHAYVARTMTAAEVGQYIQLSPRWVEREMREGRLRALRCGRKWFTSRSWLDQWIDAKRVAGKDERPPRSAS